jgi:hypothetical protein
MCESCVKKLRDDTVKSYFKTYSECVHCDKVNIILNLFKLTPFLIQSNIIDQAITGFKTISSIPLGGGFFPTSSSFHEKTQTAHPGPISWIFPGITPPSAPLEIQTVTGAIVHKTQQIHFGELSKLAVPYNWPVVKLSNVILEFYPCI